MREINCLNAKLKKNESYAQCICTDHSVKLYPMAQSSSSYVDIEQSFAALKIFLLE